MYLLYVDESGVTNPHPSQTSHYVMIGLAVHVRTWFALTSRVRSLKSAYALDGDTEKLELHAAWLLRAFHEQSVIPNFDDLSRPARYNAVQEWRKRRQHAENPWGVVVVDNDQTQKDRYTTLLQRLQLTEHYRGGVDRVIEAPFFLDSRSNSGVQVADLCAFALRRYLENQEEQRLAAIFPRFHRLPGGGLCGLKHLTSAGCTCKICSEPAGNVSRRRRRRWRDIDQDKV